MKNNTRSMNSETDEAASKHTEMDRDENREIGRHIQTQTGRRKKNIISFLTINP